jgi:hypothetical protein
MRTLTAVVVLGFLCTSVSPVLADELPVGNWTGFAIRKDNGNRQPRTFIVKTSADPYAVWRGGSGEIRSVAFGGNQNNAIEVSDIHFADGRLAFSYASPNLDATARCELVFQPKEGAYVGDCNGDGRDWRVTLMPPAPAAAKPADAKPAEAK